MPFVKLDCAMLNSSIWPDKDARDLFITALLMAEPIELREPTPTINVLNLDAADFDIPAGWYGFVPAASTGIINLAGVERERGLAAMVRLCAPEQESRNPAFDGRRLARIDGGFIVLNFIAYREKDSNAGERMRRYRQRQKELRAAKNQPPNVTRNVALKRNESATLPRIVTQAEAEAEAEEDNKTLNNLALSLPNRAAENGEHRASASPPRAREEKTKKRRKTEVIVRIPDRLKKAGKK